MKKQLAILVALVSINAQADGLTVLGGVNLNGKTDSTVSGVKTTSEAGTGMYLGAEYSRPIWSILHAAAILEHSYYNNKDDSPDHLTSLYLMPKAQYGENIRIWAGIAAGFMLYNIEKSGTWDGTTMVINTNRNDFVFSYSPRIGVDYQLTPSVSIGIQAAYVAAKHTLNQNVLNNMGVQTGTSQVESDRKFFTTALRIGFNF